MKLESGGENVILCEDDGTVISDAAGEAYLSALTQQLRLAGVQESVAEVLQQGLARFEDVISTSLRLRALTEVEATEQMCLVQSRGGKPKTLIEEEYRTPFEVGRLARAETTELPFAGLVLVVQNRIDQALLGELKAGGYSNGDRLPVVDAQTIIARYKECGLPPSYYPYTKSLNTGILYLDMRGGCEEESEV